MKQLDLEFYDTFECIGSDCPDTCCRGWDITVDDNAAEIYRNTQGAFGKRLKESIRETDGKF